MKELTENIQTIIIKPNVYIKQFPFVNDDGIYVPVEEYVSEECVGSYKCVMTKEVFIEAYNKWIRND